MRILEVRDGFIKFEANAEVKLSSFIRVNGEQKSYVAQVYQLKRAGENPIAYARFLFLYDDDLGLVNYDKTLPATEAVIEKFDYKIILDSIKYVNPVIVARVDDSNLNIVVDEKVFDKKIFISVDEEDVNNLFIRNFAKQFENLKKKFVVIDTLGIVKAKKFVAGVDFKLPLDTNSLNFMYRDCLNDATSDSKALIVEIFKDLAEYSLTVPFVSFSALKDIVDNMVDKEHVFKLLVLKNKLAKFDKLGYFAKNQAEVAVFDKILNSDSVVFDLSKLDVNFQNRYIEFIYEKLGLIKDVQVFFELSNNINKKCLKKVLEDKVATTFISHSKFKYLNDIKNLFDNFIITPSFANNQIFELYSSFLRSMQKNSSLIVGEGTNYIPIVSENKYIDDVINLEFNKEEDILSSVKDSSNTSENVEKENNNVEEVVGSESVDLENNIVESEVKEDSELLPEEENLVVEPDEIILSDNLDEDNNIKEEELGLSEEEILTSIDEKSKSVLSQIADEANSLEDVNLFTDDLDVDNSEQDNITDDTINIDIQDEESHEDEIVEEYEEISQGEIIEEISDYQDDSVISDGIVEQAFDDVDESSQNEAYSELEEIKTVEDSNQLDNIDSLEEELIKDETYSEILDGDESVSENIENLNDESLGDEPEIVEISDDIDIEDSEPVILDSEDQLIDDFEGVNTDEGVDYIPLSETSDDELGELTELTPDDITDDDIIVDLSEEPDILPDNIDEQIVKDVDKVFTTRKEDEISDTDLDFIDELNNGENDILEPVSDENDILEEIAQDDSTGILESIQEYQTPSKQDDDIQDEILETKSSSTPIVPIYSAEIPHEDLVESDSIQQGDSVTHAKYGVGVVEKMIKYGNKTLYSINFDNIGRRLLDPTLTEIKKS